MNRVLIIDNDAGTLDVLQEALVYEGFDVKTTEDADDIFGLIDEYKPNVILVDYIF